MLSIGLSTEKVKRCDREFIETLAISVWHEIVATNGLSYSERRPKSLQTIYWTPPYSAIGAFQSREIEKPIVRIRQKFIQKNLVHRRKKLNINTTNKTSATSYYGKDRFPRIQRGHHPTSVMVWWGISWKGPFLYSWSQNHRSNLPRKCSRTSSQATQWYARKDWIFQQDSRRISQHVVSNSLQKASGIYPCWRLNVGKPWPKTAGLGIMDRFGAKCIRNTPSKPRAAQTKYHRGSCKNTETVCTYPFNNEGGRFERFMPHYEGFTRFPNLNKPSQIETRG